jgi:hypothetical protein
LARRSRNCGIINSPGNFAKTHILGQILCSDHGRVNEPGAPS